MQLEWLDKQLTDREFIAVARYTIADITAQVTIDSVPRWPGSVWTRGLLTSGGGTNRCRAALVRVLEATINPLELI